MKRESPFLLLQNIFPVLKYFFYLFLFIFSVQQSFAANNKNNTTIAITQIVEHPSANKTREGILKALSDNGYHVNDNLHIIYDNAQGNLSTAVQIAQKYVSLKPDVIVAITTPSAQTVVTASNKTTIPVVFAAVTDPLHAKIVKNLEYPGGYITGATDTPPIDLQIKLITMLCPKAKKIGVVFCPGEINAVNMLIQLEKSAQKLGLEIIKAPAIKTSEVTSATQSLIGKVDAYFVALDNTVLSAMEALLKTASSHHIPCFF
jgi:putative ABC transport system substrate-binding protein